MKKLKKRNHLMPAAMLAAGIFLSTAAVIPAYTDSTPPLRKESLTVLSDEEETAAYDVTELIADYADDVYAFDHFDESKVHVYARSSDGEEQEIHEFTCEHAPQILKIRTIITIHTSYGDCSLEINPIPLKTIEASYQGSVYYGETLYLENVSATRVYEDGRTFRISSISCSILEESANETKIYVQTYYGDAVLSVKPVPVKGIELTMKEVPYIGTTPEIKSVAICYMDGAVRNLKLQELRFEDLHELQPGSNEFHFQYRDLRYAFSINGISNTYISKLTETMQEEIADSIRYHVSDSMIATVRRYRTSESDFLLTHVLINSPDQIRAGLAHDSYGGERETCSDAAKRQGWVVGVNGSNFDWSTGEPVYAGVSIKEGKVMSGSSTNGMEICLKEDGTLYSPSFGQSGISLIENGVTDSFSCGDTLLISNGVGVNYGIQSEQYRYPRTAMGMVKPGEYYFITAGSKAYERGMTYDEIRSVLLQFGCTFGKCADGGGSSTLVFEGDVLNSPAENDTERPVADFLYFVDAEPGTSTEYGFGENTSSNSSHNSNFPITKAQFIASLQNVVDTARENHYQYGDSHAEDPTTDGLISCDRLISKALWDLGYTDQHSGGMGVGELDDYLSSHGFIRSTSMQDITDCSIMLVKHQGEDYFGHAYVALGFDFNTMTGDRYDTGCQSFIDQPQPLRGKGFWYRTDDLIVYNIPE